MIACNRCGKAVGPRPVRGYCRSCYYRLLNFGGLERLPKKDGPCSIEGCGKRMRALGLCLHHWRTRPERKAIETKARKRLRLRNSYSMTLEDRARMLTDQDGRCPICQITEDQVGMRHGERKFHTDHDHRTGKVRGLLCIPCNLGIGYFRDNPAIMRAGADYIEGHKAAHAEAEARARLKD